MGIVERRARQKQSLRDEILAAARAMFAEEGFEQVSMRRLAERIEYSPTTIYLHFKDKDALFQAVSDETFHRLVVRLQKQRAAHADRPLQGLRAGLREYIDFALRHPDHYIVTFMRRPPGHATAAFEGTPGERAFDILRQAVRDCQAAGLLRPVHPEVAAQVLWMSVHGLVSLLVAKEGFPFAPRAALIETQLDTLIGGLLASPPG